MSRLLSRTELLVLFAFIALALLFAGEIFLIEDESVQITEDSSAIARIAAPSIQNLASARTELRNFQRVLGDFVDELAVGASTSRLEVMKARNAATDDLNRYLALPTFAGEDALWSNVARGDERLNIELDLLFAAADRGDIAECRRLEAELAGTIGSAMANINNLITFHGRRAIELAERIDDAHVRGDNESRAISAGCALLSIAVGVVVFRRVRQGFARLRAERDQERTRATAISDFSGRMAHDVLGPLVASEFCWDVVRQLYPEDARLASLSDRARAAHLQTNALVEDLLRFARAGERPDPDASCDARAVLNVVVDGLRPEAAQHGVTLVLDAEELGTVACAPGVLMSIAANLVRNAILHLGESKRRLVRVTARSSGEQLLFEVSDTGAGVPKELESSVFDPYVRGANSKGLGLGLSTVQRLVVAHGGRVGVKRSELGGALFHWALPRARAARHGTLSSVA